MPSLKIVTIFGKIQRGAHKRGLKPQIFRENRGEILPGKSGLFGANWRHFRAGRGLFGADRDQFFCTPQPRGKSRNCPERALLGPIVPFRAKPPFAKPPFGFPRNLWGIILQPNPRTHMTKIWPPNCRVCLVLKDLGGPILSRCLFIFLPCMWGVGVTSVFPSKFGPTCRY